MKPSIGHWKPFLTTSTTRNSVNVGHNLGSGSTLAQGTHTMEELNSIGLVHELQELELSSGDDVTDNKMTSLLDDALHSEIPRPETPPFREADSQSQSSKSRSSFSLDDVRIDPSRLPPPPEQAHISPSAHMTHFAHSSTDPSTSRVQRGGPSMIAGSGGAAAPQLLSSIKRPGIPLSELSRETYTASSVGIGLGGRSTPPLSYPSGSSTPTTTSALSLNRLTFPSNAFRPKSQNNKDKGKAKVTTHPQQHRETYLQGQEPPIQSVLAGETPIEALENGDEIGADNGLGNTSWGGVGGLLPDFKIAGKPFKTLVPSNPFVGRRDGEVGNGEGGGADGRGRKVITGDKQKRPRLRQRSSSQPDPDVSARPRGVQRTISSLLQSSRSRPNQLLSSSSQSSLHPPLSSSLPKSSSGFTNLNFPLHLGLSKPRMPSMPDLPSMNIARPFSSSGPDSKDWSSWWNGQGTSKDQVVPEEVNAHDNGPKDSRARQRAQKLLSDEDRQGTVEEQQERIERKYATPKNPLVLCHGLLGWDTLGPASLPPLQISHWRGIREVLEQNGSEVLITRVPATSSTKVRAEILKTVMEEKFEGREINIIAHSMGGLDARYLISVLKPTKFKILSLTTIATPHKGSPFADYLIDNIIGRDRLPTWLSVIDTLKLPIGGDGGAFEGLGTKSVKIFNDEVPDDPNVKYYSWGACYEPGLLDTFRWSHSIIMDKEGPNDGLVSVYSAKHGEYMGTLIGVSHPDLVGWVNQVRYTLSAWAGHVISFKPATFYLEVADHLAKHGF